MRTSSGRYQRRTASRQLSLPLFDTLLGKTFFAIFEGKKKAVKCWKLNIKALKKNSYFSSDLRTLSGPATTTVCSLLGLARERGERARSTTRKKKKKRLMESFEKKRRRNNTTDTWTQKLFCRRQVDSTVRAQILLSPEALAIKETDTANLHFTNHRARGEKMTGKTHST